MSTWPSDHVDGAGSWERENFEELMPEYVSEKRVYIKKPTLNEREVKMIAYLKEKGKASPAELSMFTDGNNRSARTSIYKLMKLGKVERVEVGVYSLTE